MESDQHRHECVCCAAFTQERRCRQALALQLASVGYALKQEVALRQRLEPELHRMSCELQEVRDQMKALYRSRSWAVTAPLRKMLTIIKKCVAGLPWPMQRSLRSWTGRWLSRHHT
jgi:hypothetical protein